MADVRKFQSTLPREERQCKKSIRKLKVYFNPRSHERSDHESSNTTFDRLISIHAPTRGATLLHQHHIHSVQISIHAPTRGATRNPLVYQSRSVISIHAPTRGATIHIKFIAVMFLNFNPRSHERSDWWGVVCTSTIYISIHAPTRGATKGGLHGCSHICNFNPRSHERSDKDTADGAMQKSISIHAPTRGATTTRPSTECSGKEFQSTLPREERRHHQHELN